MDTSSTRDRSAATWATIVVSDCIPSSSPPSVAFSPLRSSDPMISRFTGDPARASPGGGSVTSGRALSSPTRPARSTSPMFDWSSR